MICALSKTKIYSLRTLVFCYAFMLNFTTIGSLIGQPESFLRFPRDSLCCKTLISVIFAKWGYFETNHLLYFGFLIISFGKVLSDFEEHFVWKECSDFQPICIPYTISFSVSILLVKAGLYRKIDMLSKSHFMTSRVV